MIYLPRPAVSAASVGAGAYLPRSQIGDTIFSNFICPPRAVFEYATQTERERENEGRDER